MVEVIRPLVIYVDVDDTLVRSFGSKRIPISEMVARVRVLHDEGAVLYCWSSGGAAYAQEAARELGLEGCFAGFLPKPHVFIDDVRLAVWPERVELHPNEARSVSVATLRGRLGWSQDG